MELTKTHVVTLEFRDQTISQNLVIPISVDFTFIEKPTTVQLQQLVVDYCTENNLTNHLVKIRVYEHFEGLYEAVI